MKISKLFLVIMSALILTGLPFKLSAQTINGNGNVKEQSRTTGTFNSINVTGIVNVFLSQGETEKITVEADDNLLQYIVTKVKDNSLIIKTSEDVEIQKSAKMNVYVVLKSINELELNGVGNVKSESMLTLGNLDIDNNSVGNLDLNLSCIKLDMEINSVGNVTLTGSVQNVNIEQNGVGNLKAFDLSADILKISNNGVGNSEVNSDKEIYIELNGMGNVSYKGNAVIKEMDVNGFGKVNKL